MSRWQPYSSTSTATPLCQRLSHPPPLPFTPSFEVTTSPSLSSSHEELQAKLDEEYGQLVEDRRTLRKFISPRASTSVPHYLPVDLHHIMQNALQIFHLDRRKPSNLNPAYIVDSAMGKRLIVILKLFSSVLADKSIIPSPRYSPNKYLFFYPFPLLTITPLLFEYFGM
ncbi:RNA polymerase Rpb1, domain 6 domain containing protein [Amanita muscaria]